MKGGTIRRIASKFTDLFTRNKTNQYPDPVLSSSRRGMPHSKKPRTRVRQNDTRPLLRRGNLGPPKCEPGTIAYHDKLVRHFGRRQAEKYRRIIQAGQLELLPTADDFSAHPPWQHLRQDFGNGLAIISDDA